MLSNRVGRSLIAVHQLFPRGKPTFARAVSSTSRSADELRPFDPFDVKNKVMIVTGGARGLGLEIADQLYDAGAHVYCLDRVDKPGLEFETAQQRKNLLGGSLKYKRVDITDASTVDDIIHLIATQHGQIHGLVANAGITLTLDAVEHTEADVEKIWRCNFWGTFLCATAVGRHMLAQKTRGSILLVASMSGLIANKGIFSSAYNCSKAGVIQLARNLAQEWGPIDQQGRGVSLGAVSADAWFLNRTTYPVLVVPIPATYASWVDGVFNSAVLMWAFAAPAPAGGEELAANRISVILCAQRFSDRSLSADSDAVLVLVVLLAGVPRL
ncbi:hypothetical protein DTO027I6_9872 [Penicillium roqueforti]|nr:hypothetical protein CBS147337_10075 [Penicillium roqueforti]KAI3185017.1 hypothetical protein DTO027I6_9872 [Penicillium roqueforti]